MVLLAAASYFPALARAHAGPPFLTNDPGTPGNGNWEINLGSAQVTEHGAAAYQVPQIDLNFGLGERIQLTYQVPYVIAADAGGARASGWSNGTRRPRPRGGLLLSEERPVRADPRPRGTGEGQAEFNGYVGIQILLSDYGLSLIKEP